MALLPAVGLGANQKYESKRANNSIRSAPSNSCYSKAILRVWEVRMSKFEALANGSRRAFLQLSAAATAAMAFRIATEASLAAEERNVFHPGGVVIDANENPLGRVTPQGRPLWIWRRRAAAIPTG